MAVFQLDRAHTDVNFSAKHLMVTSVRGEFLDFDATLELDEADPTASSVEFRVRTASIDTGFAARDNHLRSADFFDAETYPEMVVRSTAIRHKRGNDYTVTADVTIRDVTRPVDFEVEFLGFFPGMDGARHVGFSAKATGQPQGLGTRLERRARGRRLAGRRRDPARCRGRGAGASVAESAARRPGRATSGFALSAVDRPA